MFTSLLNVHSRFLCFSSIYDNLQDLCMLRKIVFKYARGYSSENPQRKDTLTQRDGMKYYIQESTVILTLRGTAKIYYSSV